MFYFHPYLGKISNLTYIFQMGWNHQPVYLGFLQRPHHQETSLLANLENERQQRMQVATLERWIQLCFFVVDMLGFVIFGCFIKFTTYHLYSLLYFH